MKFKLDRFIYNKRYNYEDCNINIMNFIDSNLVKFNDKIWNYRDNIIIIERDNKLYYWSRFKNNLNIIHEKYFITSIDGYAIFKNINIFNQNNNEIANIIYCFVIKLLNELIEDLLFKYNNIELNGIGNEFYVYFRILKYKNYKNTSILYNGFSDDNNVLNIAKKNNSCDNYNLINYDNFNFNMKYNSITLINLKKINQNIIKNLKSKYVISITCKNKMIYGNYKALSIKRIVKFNNVKIILFKII